MVIADSTMYEKYGENTEKYILTIVNQVPFIFTFSICFLTVRYFLPVGRQMYIPHIYKTKDARKTLRFSLVSSVSIKVT